MSTADRSFTVVLDGVTYAVEVHGNSVLVDGQPFVVGFDERGVLVDGTTYDVQLAGDRAEINGIAYNVSFEGLEVGSTAATPARRADREQVAEGAGVISAIMPGKVIRVLVAEGDEVEEGDVAIILEAMKMENELRAGRAGIVQEVRVAPGDDVELGQVLVVIE